MITEKCKIQKNGLVSQKNLSKLDNSLRPHEETRLREQLEDAKKIHGS